MYAQMNLDEKELQDFLRMLDELGEKNLPKILLSGVGAAGRVFVKRAKANAPVLTGALRRSVKMYQRKGSITRAINLTAGNIERVIGPTVQKDPSPGAKSKKKIRYGWIQEARRPWLRPAFDSEVGAAAQAGFAQIVKRCLADWNKQQAASTATPAAEGGA